MHEQYQDRVKFLTVYIKEAHPDDEWQVDWNKREGVCYLQPKTMPQRIAVASDFIKHFQYEIPLAVDSMENLANELYAGWPERLYVIDEHGTIVYKGKPGPMGYHPEEVEEWLSKKFS